MRYRPSVISTDPDKYCRDIDKYEQALVTAIEAIYDLETQGYTGRALRESAFLPLLQGLYGNDWQIESLGIFTEEGQFTLRPPTQAG